jgi:hypothetical protein
MVPTLLLLLLAATKSASDAEIQACIAEGLKKSPKLSQEGFQVAVAQKVATFTGTAKQPGTKGGVYAIASNCGATRVINNIGSAIESKKK